MICFRCHGIIKNGSTYKFKEERGIRYNFHPKHQGRLREPFDVKKPSKIFTVSMGDMFGEWVPGGWIAQVFNVMAACDWHTFLTLTKNPYGIRKLYGEASGWYLGGPSYHTLVRA